MAKSALRYIDKIANLALVKTKPLDSISDSWLVNNWNWTETEPLTATSISINKRCFLLAAVTTRPDVQIFPLPRPDYHASLPTFVLTMLLPIECCYRVLLYLKRYKDLGWQLGRDNVQTIRWGMNQYFRRFLSQIVLVDIGHMINHENYDFLFNE